MSEKYQFRVGDRVRSIGKHARGLIMPGDCGTVYHAKDCIVFVSWDGCNGYLQNFPQYNISDKSGWSVYDFEVEPFCDDVQIDSLDLDNLFE